MTLARRLRVLDGGETRGATLGAAPGVAVKAAFATSDLKLVDQHFGTALSLAIFRIDRDQACLEEVVQFGQIDQDGNEDKLIARIAALRGCVAVYCQAIGAAAVNRLRPLGVQPIKVAPGEPVAGLIQALQNELRIGPAAWLARAIALQCPAGENRFDLMEAEGWSE